MRIAIPHAHLHSLGAALVLASLGCEKPVPTGSPANGPKVEGQTVSFAVGAPQLSSFRVEAVRAAQEPPRILTGRLVWDEDRTVRVVPPVAGRVVSLDAGLGARIAKGALLARMSSPDFGQAQADAARAATDLSAAERNRDRIARLSLRGALARKELDAAEADLARARAEMRRTEARLERWGASLPDAATGKGIDELFPLTAPLAGVVVERNVNPGQEVRPDATTPLFVVTDPSRLWILVDIGEGDLAGVRAGAPLDVRSAAYTGRVFTGRLEVVGAALDPGTRTVKARGFVANPDGLLKAEMYVDVELSPRGKTTVLVGAKSVLTDGEQRFVFVEESAGRFRRVPIAVGRERDGLLPVVSGLKPGDRVVGEGSLLLAAATQAERS